VTFTRDALDSLAREWLNATDRNAVAHAGDEIERRLASDPHHNGTDVREGLRQIMLHPLKVQFTIEEDDRLVTIWTVRTVVGEN
jgi:hypothetical protein